MASSAIPTPIERAAGHIRYGALYDLPRRKLAELLEALDRAITDELGISDQVHDAFDAVVSTLAHPAGGR